MARRRPGAFVCVCVLLRGIWVFCSQRLDDRNRLTKNRRRFERAQKDRGLAFLQPGPREQEPRRTVASRDPVGEWLRWGLGGEAVLRGVCPVVGGMADRGYLVQVDLVVEGSRRCAGDVENRSSLLIFLPYS